MSALETMVIVGSTTVIAAGSGALAVGLWFGGDSGGGALFLGGIAVSSVATAALACASYLTTNVWGEP